VKLKTDVSGEFDLPDTVLQSFTPNTNRVATPFEWSIPENAACAFAQELADSLELRPKDMSAWTQWLGDGPREQSLTPSSSLSCTLGEQLADDGSPAEVGVTGAVVVATSGQLDNRNGPNWWREEWQAQVDGHVLVDMKNRTVISGSFALEGRVNGSYHQSDGKIGEKYTGCLLLRVETLATNPQENMAIQSLIAELGHKQHASRKQARERAKTLQRQNLRALIAELRKSIDPELWHAADYLEQSRVSVDSQAGSTITWSRRLKATDESAP